MWIALPLLIVLWITLHVTLRRPPLGGPLLISHRGAAGLAPENTLKAIEEGIRQRAQIVEIDIRRSKDGKLVVIHDQRVDRTTDGHGEIGELTWDEIAALDAGKSFSPGFAGEQIPGLDDVLQRLSNQQVRLLIEVKDPERYPGIEKQLSDMLAKHEAQNHVLIGSFNHRWLREDFHDEAPGVSLVPIAEWLFAAPAMPAPGMVSIFWPAVLIDPTVVRRLRHKGYRVGVWTVDYPWLMRLLVWLGVDAVTTNRPDVWNRTVRRN